jgi:hypothetical protein
LATQNHSDFVSDRTAVPFLPVNPSYSSTRNQGRQKLALFNAQEFSTLVLDIVIDAKRREMGSQLDLNDGKKVVNCDVEVTMPLFSLTNERLILIHVINAIWFCTSEYIENDMEGNDHDYDEVASDDGILEVMSWEVSSLLT